MTYSICASSLYLGQPLPEAFRRISALGFDTCEIWQWHRDGLEAVASAAEKYGLKLIAACATQVPLTDPARHQEYMEALREDLRAARRMGCEFLLAQVGPELPDVPRAEQHAAIVAGLRACAPLLEEAGVTLAVEPLNRLVDHKGYYLTSSLEGLEIVREVASPRVKLVFDVYHQQVSEGNLLENLRACLPEVVHIHIAGNPGRHEPWIDSEVHYPTIIRAARAAGYTGRIGLEYIPLLDPDESLREAMRQLPQE